MINILISSVSFLKAIINQANAEASTIREIARALSRSGEEPSVYLLAMKYTNALKAIMSAPNTKVILLIFI